MKLKELAIAARSLLTSIYDDAILRTYTSVFGHEISERFVILGHARTGSNYLLDGIISSKAITAYHEIFADHNRKIGEDFEKILSQLYRKESRNTRMVGFKLFYNHMTAEEWTKFTSHKEFKVIHLTRANRLRTIVSLDVAFKTDEWTRSSRAKEKKLDDKRITLDITKLLTRLETIEAQEQLARERFKDKPLIEVVYEDMVKDPQKTFKALGEFLEVDDIDFTKIKILRQNSERLDQLIVNYEEVRQLLENSKFADCLND